MFRTLKSSARINGGYLLNAIAFCLLVVLANGQSPGELDTKLNQLVFLRNQHRISPEECDRGKDAAIEEYVDSANERPLQATLDKLESLQRLGYMTADECANLRQKAIESF